MSESELLSIIICICNHMGTKESNIACRETYANCGVYSDGRSRDGQIKTLKDFDHQCYFVVGQSQCYFR